MKLFTSFTIGALFILAGILFIAKSYFNVNINITRVVFGIVIILFGLNLLFGNSFYNRENNLIFSSGTINHGENTDEYNVIFGSGVIDLSTLNPENFTNPIEVNVIFGSTVLKINPDTPINVEANTIFGTTRTPENQTNFFGDSTYEINKTDDRQVPVLNIETNTIFGELKIVFEK